MEKSEASPPKLPFTPVHTENAFLEDHVHDYVLRQGQFHYYSRVTDLTKSGVWLLFEGHDTK